MTAPTCGCATHPHQRYCDEGDRLRQAKDEAYADWVNESLTGEQYKPLTVAAEMQNERKDRAADAYARARDAVLCGALADRLSKPRIH